MTKEELYRLHLEWIDRCELSDNLSEWEESFVASVKEQLLRKGSISSRQVEILEKIYADKTD